MVVVLVLDLDCAGLEAEPLPVWEVGGVPARYQREYLLCQLLANERKILTRSACGEL